MTQQAKRSRKELLRRVDRVLALAGAHLEEISTGLGKKSNLEAYQTIERVFTALRPKVADGQEPSMPGGGLGVVRGISDLGLSDEDPVASAALAAEYYYMHFLGD